MDYWTAGMKQLHAVTMQNSIIDELLKGKIDKRLSRLGIDDANAMNIARATREIRRESRRCMDVKRSKLGCSRTRKDLGRCNQKGI
jgi:hypothetical protein